MTNDKKPDEGQMNERLLPCPFCGGKAEFSFGNWDDPEQSGTYMNVRCNDCSATSDNEWEPHHTSYDTHDQTIEKAAAFKESTNRIVSFWNRRTPTSQPLVESQAGDNSELVEKLRIAKNTLAHAGHHVLSEYVACAITALSGKVASEGGEDLQEFIEFINSDESIDGNACREIESAITAYLKSK